MKEENKQLLLIDISARLSYHPILHFDDKLKQENEYLYSFRENSEKFLINDAYYIEEIKPYLRSIDNISDEESNEMEYLLNRHNIEGFLDFVHSHHIDWRNLIEKGLALEAHKNMYNIPI